MLPDGTLLETTPVALPATVRNMMKRSMTEQNFMNFYAVQMFAIVYMSGGLRIHGFMALPPAHSSAVYPGLIFNRGGHGPRGALSAESAYVYAGLYASWGYVTLASNYRGQGGSEGQEEWGGEDINDAQNLLPLLQSLGYVDMTRVGLVGGSRGGMMALMMLRQSSAFRAAITIGAPTLLHETDAHSSIKKTAMKYVEHGQHFVDELRRRSATVWSHELCRTTPLHIMHGSGDKRVPTEHALHLALALQQHLIPYRLTIYDNADHILAGRRDESNSDIRWWLDYYVRDAKPLPVVGAHGA